MCGGALVALLLGFAASAALSRSQGAVAPKDDSEVLDQRGQRWRMSMSHEPSDRADEFRFEIKLTNIGGAVQQLDFDKQDQIAVLVRGPNGSIVWRDGGPNVPIQISRTVAARSGIVYPVLWDASDAPSGDYTVEARILSHDFTEFPALETAVTVP